MTARDHWQSIYSRRPSSRWGWYEPDPVISRRRIAEAVERGAQSFVDIGGGASFVVDHALALGLKRVAVLDISEAALELARLRLGERETDVEWIVGDITELADIGRFDIWHDRAVFHFVTDPQARRRYVELSERTVGPGGSAIMATFAPDGPERCSGLPVCRYAADELAEECGPGWTLQSSERHVHVTPSGIEQRYVYATLLRSAPAER